MEDKIYNKLIIEGKTFDEIYDFLDVAVIDGKFLFNNLICIGNTKKAFIEESLKNWGCKHDLDNQARKVAKSFNKKMNRKLTKYSTYAKFETLYYTPRLYIDKVSQLYPNLTFQCVFEKEDSDILGSYKYRNGEIISSEDLSQEENIDRLIFRFKNKFKRFNGLKEIYYEHEDKLNIFNLLRKLEIKVIDTIRK